MEMSFLNASLFDKNFNNLTRNNSYEFTKIVTGVAYGTDVKKVREVPLEAMKQHVLVAERIGYIDRAKEVIYDALNANGISIRFPQCDVHLVNEEK